MHSMYEQGPTSACPNYCSMGIISLHAISVIVPAQWHSSSRAVGISQQMMVQVLLQDDRHLNVLWQMWELSP